MTQMKHKVVTVVVSAMAVYLAVGCTLQLVPAAVGNAAVPTAASASAVTETGVLATPTTMHGEASDAAIPTPSAYREFLDGEIRGIDPQTIAGYLAGEGLGMALPAELNGYPGPRHVLDLRSELGVLIELEQNPTLSPSFRFPLGWYGHLSRAKSLLQIGTVVK